RECVCSPSITDICELAATASLWACGALHRCCGGDLATLRSVRLAIPQWHAAGDCSRHKCLVWSARPGVVGAHSRLPVHGLLFRGAALFLQHCKLRCRLLRELLI